ncbi:hypothetical protein NP493_316g00001 [Ridgeia piscesae]|uniref:Uncharacterized protein n=1 Tax=Ridgeia piscesae TaxID=27915 RepID=A0AAD9NUW5_RIDPI|nr:hypothetical protein NP493_316g00001 [Ridgeia piscesae]
MENQYTTSIMMISTSVWTSGSKMTGWTCQSWNWPRRKPRRPSR